MRFVKKLFILGAGFLIILLLMNFVVMPWYVRHNTLVKVPDVKGLTFEEAKKKLDEAGLEGLQGDIRYDAEKPIGTVIDQLPPAGQIVKDSRRIYLIISGGEQLYEVPNLVGRSLREAKFMLNQRNLGAQEVEYKPSVQYPPGTVLSQLEQPGMKLRKGTKIGLIVSVGSDGGDIKVPDITAKSIDDARKILASSKLQIGKINYQPSSRVPVNTVIDQYPKANSMVKENQRIDIFVNREQKKKIVIEGDEQGIKEEMKTIEDHENFNNGEIKPIPREDGEKPADREKRETDKKEEKKTKPKDKKETDKKNEGGTRF